MARETGPHGISLSLSLIPVNNNIDGRGSTAGSRSSERREKRSHPAHCIVMTPGKDQRAEELFYGSSVKWPDALKMCVRVSVCTQRRHSFQIGFFSFVDVTHTSPEAAAQAAVSSKLPLLLLRPRLKIVPDSFYVIDTRRSGFPRDV